MNSSRTESIAGGSISTRFASSSETKRYLSRRAGFSWIAFMIAHFAFINVFYSSRMLRDRSMLLSPPQFKNKPRAMQILSRWQELQVAAPPLRLVFNGTDFGGLDISFQGIERRTIAMGDMLQELKDDDETGNGTAYTIFNCNAFHELGLETTESFAHSKKLGRGVYRVAFLLEKQLPLGQVDVFAYKKMRRFSRFSFDSIWSEAVAMQSLTRSPFILNIYGYCHSSTLVESSKLCETVRSRLTRLSPYDDNNHGSPLTLPHRMPMKQKLSYLLQIARSLRDLHDAGFSHNDFKSDQIILFNNNRIKLGDFNFAEEIWWNTTAKRYETWVESPSTNEYCHTPESCFGWERGDKSDIFGFGAIMLSFLIEKETSPSFHRTNKTYTRQDMPLYDIAGSLKGVERSYVQIMHSCWQRGFHRRPSARELVAMIEALVQQQQDS